ncbi:MAG: hypothetical protein Q4C70_05690 [Planctomycetia bacterium]|nr:hypothetical protein [Planctomycetia bacterium]
MANYYYYDKNNQKIGPMNVATIRNLALSGVVTPDTIIELDSGQVAKAKMFKNLKFGTSTQQGTNVYNEPLVNELAPTISEIDSTKTEVSPISDRKNITPPPILSHIQPKKYLSTLYSSWTSMRFLAILGTSILGGIILLLILLFFLLKTEPETLRYRGIAKLVELGNTSPNMKNFSENPEAKKIFQLFQKAADQGDSEAHFYLAECYLNGIGISKDEHEGIDLMQKAASLNCAEAVSQLGSWYFLGIHVPKNIKKAEELATKADELFVEKIKILRTKAKKENGYAQIELGTIYLSGKGTQKDIHEAYKWLEMAEKCEITFPKDLTTFMSLYRKYKNGDLEAMVDISKYLDDEDAEQMIMEIAEKGHAEAQYLMGMNESLPAQQQIQWLQKAAEQNHANAQAALGCKYMLGDGVKYSDELAEKWLLAAAKQNCRDSYFSLGLLYRGSNNKKAIEWFQKAGGEVSQECIQEIESGLHPEN